MATCGWMSGAPDARGPVLRRVRDAPSPVPRRSPASITRVPFSGLRARPPGLTGGPRRRFSRAPLASGPGQRRPPPRPPRSGLPRSAAGARRRRRARSADRRGCGDGGRVRRGDDRASAERCRPFAPAPLPISVRGLVARGSPAAVVSRCRSPRQPALSTSAAPDGRAAAAGSTGTPRPLSRSSGSGSRSCRRSGRATSSSAPATTPLPCWPTSRLAGAGAEQRADPVGAVHELPWPGFLGDAGGTSRSTRPRPRTPGASPQGLGARRLLREAPVAQRRAERGHPPADRKGS